jgi:hypothetical protein
LSGEGNIDTGSGNSDPTDPTGHVADGNNGEDERSSYSNRRTPELWILVLAITIVAFGITLLALRSVIFSLMLITIGVSLFALWLYVGVRLKEKQDYLIADYKTGSSFSVSRSKEKENVCTCPVCKHTESKSCMKKRCPCCILARNKGIIGHFNNPLE